MPYFIKLHQDKQPILISLDSIQLIQESYGDAIIIFERGCKFKVDESYKDIEELIRKPLDTAKWTKDGIITEHKQLMESDAND